MHTLPLKGLSYRDLELAVIIDSFDFSKYELITLKQEKGYKKIIRAAKIDEEMAALESEIIASEGLKRFGNKFKTSEYEKNFGKASH